VQVTVDLVGLADDMGVALRLHPTISSDLAALQAGLLTGYGFGLYGIAGPALYRILKADPPLSQLYINPLPDEEFKIPETRGVVSAFQTISGTVLVDVTTSNMLVEDFPLAMWEQEGVRSLEYNRLTVLNGSINNDLGEAIGSGNLLITSSQMTSLLFLQSSIPVLYELDGIGSKSLYAPAISGLGAGSNWITYTLSLTSTQPYTLTIEDAIITINNTETYTGSFTIVTTDTTTIEGSGPTAVPNFASTVSIQTQNGRLTLGPATGTVLVGGQPLDASNGLALANYTGPITITEATTMTDQVELNGDADFFTLHLSPESSTTDPNTPVTFQTVINANFDDTYTTTVEAPAGWNVELDAAGLITATPPLGATPGDYAILVTAESSAYPDLFVSAIHVVTTTPFQGMVMAVAEDSLITVPIGPAKPGTLPGDTNSGQIQLPDAAYTIDVTNTSTVSHTFDVSVTGLPAGWLILSGAEGNTDTTVTLPAGGVGQIGLYISPTLPLPGVGAAYPFNVTATAVDNPTLTQNDDAVFTMTAVPFNYVAVNPPLIQAAPNSTTTLDIAITNAGNAAGSFPVSVTPPDTGWGITNRQSPIPQPVDETGTQTSEAQAKLAAVEENPFISQTCTEPAEVPVAAIGKYAPKAAKTRPL